MVRQRLAGAERMAFGQMPYILVELIEATRLALGPAHE
jgi:hypothetical protein